MMVCTASSETGARTRPRRPRYPLTHTFGSFNSASTQSSPSVPTCWGGRMPRNLDCCDSKGHTHVNNRPRGPPEPSRLGSMIWFGFGSTEIWVAGFMEHMNDHLMKPDLRKQCDTQVPMHTSTQKSYDVDNNR